MVLDYLIGFCLNGYKKKRKIFFIPKYYNCGKKCTETTTRRFVLFSTMTYSDICYGVIAWCEIPKFEE